MTAKNSIKIRSFGLGTKAFCGVGVEGIFVEIAVADTEMAVAVDAAVGCSCGTAHEARKRVMKQAKIYRFMNTLARTDVIYITADVRID